MKRIFSLMLSVVMFVSVLSVCGFHSFADVSTDHCYEYKEDRDGNVIITDYKGSAFDVRIPETIDGKTVTAIRNAFHYRESYEYFTGEHMNKLNVRTIHIPKTVKSISFVGKYTLPMLNYIEVDKNNPYFSSENGVLFNKDKTVLLRFPAARRDNMYTVAGTVQTIGASAFENAKYLTEVKLGKGVTTIGLDAFYNCTEIRHMYIPKTVKHMKYCGLGIKAYAACWTHPDNDPGAEDYFEVFRETIPGFKIYGKKGSAGETYCQSRKNYFSKNDDCYADELVDQSFEDLTFVAVPLKDRPDISVKVKNGKVVITMNNYIKENQKSFFESGYKISAKKGSKDYLLKGYEYLKLRKNVKIKGDQLVYTVELPKGEYKIKYRAVYYVSGHKIETKWSNTKTVTVK